MPPRGISLGTDNQASAQTAKQLKAARTGESFYITKIVISNGATAGDIRLVNDTTGTPTDLMPKLYFPINGLLELDLSNSPLKVPVGKDIGYTSTTVTTHSVIVFGYSLPSTT